MNEQLREQLSALMDGQWQGDELRFLLRRLDADTESRRLWSRYHCAGAALRRETAVPVLLNFSETVMLRIAREAQPLARRRGGVLLRWASGGAIAAAAAVVALVAWHPAGENPANPMPGIAALQAIQTPSSPASGLSGPTLPMLTNFDYAQPASYDNVIPMTRYDLRRRYDGAADNFNGFAAPYVLLSTPPPANPGVVPANPSLQAPSPSRQ